LFVCHLLLTAFYKFRVRIVGDMNDVLVQRLAFLCVVLQASSGNRIWGLVLKKEIPGKTSGSCFPLYAVCVCVCVCVCVPLAVIIN
jgi:hypothetical protein